MERKYFTVQQANFSLILVIPVVKDILRKRKIMIALKKGVKAAKMIKRMSKEITYHLEELEMIGCYLKDFELGVVDFPTILNGRVVFLTFQYGDVKVDHYHEVVHNFDKKKPITQVHAN